MPEHLKINGNPADAIQRMFTVRKGKEGWPNAFQPPENRKPRCETGLDTESGWLEQLVRYVVN